MFNKTVIPLVGHSALRASLAIIVKSFQYREVVSLGVSTKVHGLHNTEQADHEVVLLSPSFASELPKCCAY